MLRVLGMSPAVRRPLVMGVALAVVLLVGAPAFAQDAAAPAAPVLALDGDAATITVLIKPDKRSEERRCRERV